MGRRRGFQPNEGSRWRRLPRVPTACRGASLAQPAPKTVWWHQIDDENDESYELKDFTEWHATKDLRGARLHLMNNRRADGVAALEKLRADLMLYARDAA